MWANSRESDLGDKNSKFGRMDTGNEGEGALIMSRYLSRTVPLSEVRIKGRFGQAGKELSIGHAN